MNMVCCQDLVSILSGVYKQMCSNNFSFKAYRLSFLFHQQIEARAERFGIPLNEEARKQARAERFAGNSTSTAINKKPAKLSMETGVR